MAAHHAMVTDRRATLEVAGRSLIKLVNETRARTSGRSTPTLRCSPAMAAGLSTTLWSMEDVVALIDVQAEPAKKRGSYNPRKPKAS